MTAHNPPDVLLLSVDTLRRDHLAPYGRDLMPHVSALLESAGAFDRCMATSPWTGASFASVLTGLWPAQHGCRANAPTLDSPETTRSPIFGDVGGLTEILKESGYHTLCSQGNSAYCGPNFGFARGFDDYSLRDLDFTLARRPRERIALRYAATHGTLWRYLDFCLYRVLRQWRIPRRHRRPWIRRAGTIVKQAVAGLRRAPSDRPVFAWVNFIDLHMPYDAPSRWMNPARPPGRVRPVHIWPSRHLDEELSDDDKQYIRQRYACTARYVDHEIDALLRAWPLVRGNRSRLTVFLSDHGEEFWDHGQGPSSDRLFTNRGIDHGHTLFNELLHVPLAFHWPEGGVQGRRIEAMASLIDVAPTVLDLLGLKEQRQAMQGRSLARCFSESAPEDDRVVFADSLLYGQERKAAISATHKLVSCPETGQMQLFAWGAGDAAERADRFDDPAHAEVQARLQRELARWEALLPADGQQAAFTEEQEKIVIDQLRNLGYL